MASHLPYIDDEILVREVRKVLAVASAAVKNAENHLYRSKIDPFSAVFDSMRQWIPLSEWLEQEKTRQIQKTLQNALGDFHQAILGNMTGWVDLGVGGVADVRNDNKKVVAEIKNKFNTTKGNHKKVIYDDLLGLLNSSCKGYRAYYVEIIPSSPMPYDKPFTPSDNETHLRRPVNDSIRVIDGRSFYALVSGYPDALDVLYETLPVIISDAMGLQGRTPGDEGIARDLFRRVYKTKD